MFCRLKKFKIRNIFLKDFRIEYYRLNLIEVVIRIRNASWVKTCRYPGLLVEDMIVWQISIESRSEIMLVHCNQGALLSARARAKVVDPRNQDQRST